MVALVVVKVDRLKLLARSLGNYSSSLKLLFADASADKKAFGKAVGGLATAVGGLQGEIERASGAKGVNTKALGAIEAIRAGDQHAFGPTEIADSHRHSKVMRYGRLQ